jgi:flagellar assembly factor FliW
MGEHTVDRSRVFTLPLGLPRIEHATTFVLIQPGTSRFFWLQSTELPHVGMFVVEARTIFPGYPEHQVRQALGYCDLERDEEVAVLAICRIPHEPEPATVNLQAPIGLGLRSRRGGQVLLYGTDLTIDMPLR